MIGGAAVADDAIWRERVRGGSRHGNCDDVPISVSVYRGRFVISTRREAFMGRTDFYVIVFKGKIICSTFLSSMFITPCKQRKIHVDPPPQKNTPVVGFTEM